MAFDGQIGEQSPAQVRFLLEAANRFLDKSDFEREILISEDHFYDKIVCLLMTRLVQEEVTNTLVDDLNRLTEKIQYQHRLKFLKGDLPYGVYIANIRSSFSPDVLAAFAFSQQLAMGSFVGLKRCLLLKCQRFFIGRPNAKWCSKKCGSSYRVSKMRKEAKH
jgi:hypothetical protein